MAEVLFAEVLFAVTGLSNTFVVCVAIVNYYFQIKLAVIYLYRTIQNKQRSFRSGAIL